ncbi:MAG: hypothetical protein Q9216_002839 [Gyalolechia sp. 2 TL-2023]
MSKETSAEMSKETSTKSSTQLVIFDPTKNAQMRAYNPPVTLQITLQLLFTTSLGPVLVKLEELTAAYDYGFRDFIYGILQVSLSTLAFLALRSLREGLEFYTANPAVSALLYVFAACVPYMGRLAPYLRQFLSACFGLVMDFAEAIGHCIPEGAKTTARGFFTQTAPDLFNRSFNMAGIFGRTAGQTAVTIIVVPARFLQQEVLVPLVHLPSTAVEAVDRKMVRPVNTLIYDGPKTFALWLRKSSPVAFWILKHLFSGRIWPLIALVLLTLIFWMAWWMPYLVLHSTKATVWNLWVVAQALSRILFSVSGCLVHAVKEEIEVAVIG